MVPPESPPRPRAQPQPAWGVRRRRPPGPMQRLSPPEGRGRRARGAAAASVAARIPARAPVAASARCPRCSAPAPSPRPGLPRRIRWIIRLPGPRGNRNFGEGREGRGQAALPAPRPPGPPPGSALEEGGPRRLPQVRAPAPRAPPVAATPPCRLTLA